MHAKLNALLRGGKGARADRSRDMCTDGNIIFNGGQNSVIIIHLEMVNQGQGCTKSFIGDRGNEGEGI